ncbi:DNA-deoxyinosine glycosylase [Glacieibacterium frigidum]|uniref:DNA-deoxyinosine glycosylase n=1 Tax=Glacieibacterium frigidum TaxID=2593303 RepID=A0A552U9L7_9SPHN|nr:DNA-deoxyinosine glycosylase [Glacieibacterium frigidum]TRW14911.1 DNA-deoxyinosine glycosylase [Glacieibacterium frigidum]
MTLKASFGAVTDARTQVLILGSLPGERSLAAREYYAHPQNRFWELVGAVIDRDLRALAYAERLAALGAAGIGLWDTVATARRTGSLDSAIRDAAANDLASLVATLPALRAVAFNGATAARIGRAQLPPAPPFALVDLPSSSPAHARMSFDAKRDRWRVLAGLLG